jgi:pantoate--beta-alanine ligase
VTPVIARSLPTLAAARASLPGPVVLVPTMGALHDGHRALLRQARQLAASHDGASQHGASQHGASEHGASEHGSSEHGASKDGAGPGSVLVSVFVNPLQFGPGEDFARYPRDLDRDVALCAEEGASLVFAPDQAGMYPAEPLVRVDPGPVGQVLEGRSRPGFFPGMLTVVLKLFQLTAPDVAVFGAKDAQQLALVRRMTADFNLGVRIAAAPIVRDPDGLAASSRNAYLSAAERVTALALSRALAAGEQAAGDGAAAVRAAVGGVLAAAASADPPLALDYLALVAPDTFTEVADDACGPAQLLVAARVGATRLIDNAVLTLAGADLAGAGQDGLRRAGE